MGRVEGRRETLELSDVLLGKGFVVVLDKV